MHEFVFSSWTAEEIVIAPDHDLFAGGEPFTTVDDIHVIIAKNGAILLHRGEVAAVIEGGKCRREDLPDISQVVDVHGRSSRVTNQGSWVLRFQRANFVPTLTDLIQCKFFRTGW